MGVSPECGRIQIAASAGRRIAYLGMFVRGKGPSELGSECALADTALAAEDKHFAANVGHP